MTGKTRIVRAVKSCGSSGCDQHFFCADLVGRTVCNGKTDGSFDLIIVYQIIGNV